jgi:hypothetical protein
MKKFRGSQQFKHKTEFSDDSGSSDGDSAQACRRCSITPKQNKQTNKKKSLNSFSNNKDRMNSKVKTQFLASKMTNLCALLLFR